MLARNIQTSLATKVQDVSSSFRKQQSSYLQSKYMQFTAHASLLFSAYILYVFFDRNAGSRKS